MVTVMKPSKQLQWLSFNWPVLSLTPSWEFGYKANQQNVKFYLGPCEFIVMLIT